MSAATDGLNFECAFLFSLLQETVCEQFPNRITDIKDLRRKTNEDNISAAKISGLLCKVFPNPSQLLSLKEAGELLNRFETIGKDGEGLTEREQQAISRVVENVRQKVLNF